MIGKGKSISHTKASLEYGWNQEKDAKLVFKQYLAGNNPKEITEEIKIIQSTNNHCKRNTFSFVISPTIEDGKKLNTGMLKKITSEFVKELNLNDRQAVAFVHEDKEHKHIHLYVNRIDFRGKAYNDSYIGKKAQKAAEKVALKLGLKTVAQVKNEKKQNTKLIRKTIFNFHKECILIGKPNNFTDYIKKMQDYGVNVKPSISKTNQLLGFIYEYQGQSFKGSAVHREMSINKVALQINYKQEDIKYLKNQKSIKIFDKKIGLNDVLIGKIEHKIQPRKIHRRF